MCVRDSEETLQSLSVTIVHEMWFDKSQSSIGDRYRGVKQESVKQEPMVKVEGAAAAAASGATSASSPFSPQFQQLVQLIVGVM